MIEAEAAFARRPGTHTAAKPGFLTATGVFLP
jgi:hypothetical protein